ALASALGTKDAPDAVSAAIASDPQAAAKIKQAELDNAVQMRQLLVTARTTELQQRSADLSQVNQTMRAELGADGVFKSGWRAAIGWTMALSFACMTGSLCYALIDDPGRLNDVISGLMTMIIAMSAVVGVNIHKTSQEKQTAMTGLPQAGLLSLLKK
nr:3TM-type holin [Salinisphaera sp.]